MTSGKKARTQRRTPPPPPVRSTGGRRASPKVLAAVAGAIALAAVAAALAFALTGGSSSNTSTNLSTLPDASTAVQLFKGIPQSGNVLGLAKAPVTMVEYIDLQCPGCRAFETEVMPTIVSRYIRSGKVRVEARPLAFIQPAQNSQRGRLAALAAGEQGHFFDFAQLVYYNQGSEGSSWLNDLFIRSAYASIPGFDSATAERARTSAALAARAARFDNEANADHLRVTPTIFVGKTGGKQTEVVSPDVPTLSAAIDRALA